MKERFSLAARVRSVGPALAGLATLLRTQHNAWLHLAATVAVVALAAWLDVAARDWLWLVAALAGVWVAEALNTAVERLADAVTTDHHPAIGQAKDVAAAGVLLASLAAAIVGVLVLWPYVSASR